MRARPCWQRHAGTGHTTVCCGICPKNILQALVVLDSCSPVYFSAPVQHASRRGCHDCKANAADRINADTLKRLALMLEGVRVL